MMKHTIILIVIFLIQSVYSVDDNYIAMEVKDRAVLNTLFSTTYSYPADSHDISRNAALRAHFWARSFEVSSNILSFKIFFIA